MTQVMHSNWRCFECGATVSGSGDSRDWPQRHCPTCNEDRPVEPFDDDPPKGEEQWQG